MDISMDIHRYIHGYLRKIRGYGWQISYPRKPVGLYLVSLLSLILFLSIDFSLIDSAN